MNFHSNLSTYNLFFPVSRSCGILTSVAPSKCPQSESLVISSVTPFKNSVLLGVAAIKEHFDQFDAPGNVTNNLTMDPLKKFC